MNFRLALGDKTNNKFENIVKTYLKDITLYKEESSKILKEKNELYNYISTKIKNNNLNRNSKNKNFYSALIDSINILGIHLTAKYYEGKALNNYNFYTKNEKELIYNNILKIFNIYPKKDKSKLTKFTPFKKKDEKKYPRVPSATDRIIFALSGKNNIKISPYNFDVYLFPDKSDHKMISLSFELSDNILKAQENANKAIEKINTNNISIAKENLNKNANNEEFLKLMLKNNKESNQENNQENNNRLSFYSTKNKI
jgi:hypothetical protein